MINYEIKINYIINWWMILLFYIQIENDFHDNLNKYVYEYKICKYILLMN